MEKKTFIILFLIVLFGFVLRFVEVSSLPPSLNWDEVSHGYNAYSILKTGMDEWGKKFPLVNFRAYGDYPLPLNLYLTIPFIIIFGLTEFAIRLPHVMLGALTVVSTFFVSFGLSKSTKISYLSAFLVAISPWTLFTSRFVLQSNLSVFLLTTSIACFLNREYSKKLVSISFFLLGLSLFAYNTTRIIAPLILLTIAFLAEKSIWTLRNKLIIALFFIPLPFILLSPEARARNSVVAIVDQGAINRIETQRNESKYSRFLTKAIYNKPVYFFKEFSKNYIGYFSPKFLFFEGGTQYQFSLPKSGLLYLVNLPLFYIGLFILLMKAIKKDVNYILLLIILLLAPIPAAMTNEKFAVLRSSAMIPIPMILSAIGFYEVLEKLNSKHKVYILAFYIIILLFSLESYFIRYYTSYRLSYSQSWQYGYKEVAEFIEDNNDNYAKIVMTKKYGEPHEFLLWHLKFDPARYMNDKNLNRFNQSNWWWVDSFDKYYFVNDWQIPKEGYKFVQESKKTVDCRQAKCILITSPNNAPSDWEKVKTINFLDNTPAFELYENN